MLPKDAAKLESAALESSANGDDAAAARAVHLAHLEWVVEHHPESGLAAEALAAPDEFEPLKQVWLRQADRYSQDPRVLRNAAQFFANRENGVAIRLMKQVVALQPENRDLGQRLGTMLALAAIDPRQEGVLAEAAREDLRHCANANVCGWAGIVVSRAAVAKRGAPGFSQDEADLGVQLLAKARSVDPGNPQWSGSGGVGGVVLGGVFGSVPLPAAAGSASPGPPPATIRVGGNVQEANLLRQTKPEYPALAKQARIQGTVRFTATIAKDGIIENLTLVSGHPLLVQAAQAAAKEWVYKPTLLNGEPVRVVTTIDVNFTLNEIQ